VIQLWDEMPTYLDIDDTTPRGYCKRCGCNVRVLEYRQDQYVDEVCPVHLERLDAPVEEETTEDF
jgi:hypothetical protein